MTGRRRAAPLLALGLPLGLALGLASCAADGSSGLPSAGIVSPAIAEAYLPLASRDFLVIDRWGAALVIAPHVAVTNAHNANLIPSGAILGRSEDYDLLFFRTPLADPPPIAQARAGQHVIAYGQGADGALREAQGVVRSVAARVAARCASCPQQVAIAFDAEAGKGFSGGPVVDGSSRAVIGLVFGYRDGEAKGGGRRMFAYDIDLVLSEMRRLRISPSTSRAGVR